MSKYLKSEFTQADVNYIAVNMRSKDAAECRAGGLEPLAALQNSLDRSEWKWLIEDQYSNPVGFVGVTKSGCVWLLGTEQLISSREFIRQSRVIKDYIFEVTGHEMLWNLVWVYNHEHVRWLEWLGADFAGVQYHNDNPFVLFYLGKE